MTTIIYNDNIFMDDIINDTLESLIIGVYKNTVDKNKFLKQSEKENISKQVRKDVTEIYLKSCINEKEESFEYFLNGLGYEGIKKLDEIVLQQKYRFPKQHLNEILESGRKIKILTKMPYFLSIQFYNDAENSQIANALVNKNLRIITPNEYFHEQFPKSLSPDRASIKTALLLKAVKEVKESQDLTLYVDYNTENLKNIRNNIPKDQRKTKIVRHIGSVHTDICKEILDCFLDLDELKDYVKRGIIH